MRAICYIRHRRERKPLHISCVAEVHLLCDKRGIAERQRNEWIDSIPLRLFIERLFQFGKLLGICLRQIVRLTVIVSDMVKLPLILIEVAAIDFLWMRQHLPWSVPSCTCPPTIFVDGPIPKHLKVLLRVTLRCFSILEGINETLAFKR